MGVNVGVSAVSRSSVAIGEAGHFNPVAASFAKW